MKNNCHWDSVSFRTAEAGAIQRSVSRCESAFESHGSLLPSSVLPTARCSLLPLAAFAATFPLPPPRPRFVPLTSFLPLPISLPSSPVTPYLLSVLRARDVWVLLDQISWTPVAIASIASWVLAFREIWDQCGVSVGSNKYNKPSGFNSISAIAAVRVQVNWFGWLRFRVRQRSHKLQLMFLRNYIYILDCSIM